jgi:hypothetical protein
MTLKVQVVNAQYVAQIWPLIEEFITRALEHTDDATAEQVRVYLANGTWLLLVIVDEESKIHGAVTVTFENSPNHRSAIFTAASGKDIVNKDLFEQVCGIMKSFGATRVRCLARDSAVRLYERIGLCKKATLMELKL